MSAVAAGGQATTPIPLATRLVGSWWAPIMIGAIALAICWLRLPAEARATLWAEDGRIFVSEREQLGPFATLYRPYAGYLQLVPRIITNLIVGIVPVGSWALAFTALSCATAAAVCAITYCCARSVTSRTATSVALALIPVLVPIGPIEVSGNAANLHSYFLWLTPWLLFARPRRATTAVFLGVVALAGALTEIQSLVFIPLVVWRWRDRRGWPVRVGLILGLACQVVATLLSPRQPGRATTYHAWSTIEGFVANAMMGSVTAQPHAVAAAMTTGVALLAIVILLFGTAIATALVSGCAESRVIVAACVAASVIIWSVAYLANPYPGFDFAAYNSQSWATFGFMRYGVVPAMFLLATIPLAADVLTARTARFVGAIAAGVVAIVVVMQWNPAATQRSEGPLWSHGVIDVSTSCSQAKSPPFVQVPTAPAGWFADVRCSAISAGR